MATALLRRFGSAATVVEPDWADNRVLECAVAGEASYIITGDAHLLQLKEYRGIVILTPVEFLTFSSWGNETRVSVSVLCGAIRFRSRWHRP